MATKKWTTTYNCGHNAGYNKGVRRAFVLLLGNRCQAPDCLVQGHRSLQFHHVYGGGEQDRRSTNSSGTCARVTFLYIRRFCEDPRSIRLLCADHHREAEQQLRAARARPTEAA